MQLEPVVEIQGALREGGVYRTPPGLRRRVTDRWLGRWDLYLYARVVAAVLRGWPRARWGDYTSDFWARQSAWVTRALECCGARLEVEGFAPVAPSEGPVVYASNHMSMAETMILPCILLCRGPVSFVVKESLLGYPVLGNILRKTAAVAVGRANPRDDFKTVMQEGAARLAAGRSVVVFPQSTRLVEFDPAQFNSLAVKLARKADVPLVPLALKTDFMGIGAWLRDFGPLDRGKTLHFRFEPPRRVEDARAAQEHVVRFIASSLRGWGGHVKERTTP